MIYIASPYWHEKKKIRKYRRKQAIRYSLNLARWGILNYCPLLYTSWIKDLEIPEEYWLFHSTKMIDAAHVIHVLCLDGWEESKGVSQEIDVAEGKGLPVSYIDPWLVLR